MSWEWLCVPLTKRSNAGILESAAQASLTVSLSHIVISRKTKQKTNDFISWSPANVNSLSS